MTKSKIQQSLKDGTWDPAKVNCNVKSILLIQHFNEQVEIWWDKDRFDSEWNSWALAEYCSDYIETWWDADKFNWINCGRLAEHCSEHFETWWDPDKWNWHLKYMTQSLENNCRDKFSDADWLILKLKYEF